MARLSKTCHSPTCGGTKQRITLALHPGGIQVRYVATCQACGAEHPPDSPEIVADGKDWEAATRAAHGGRIPDALPAPPAGPA